jgi:glycosyltransferase 2 family protein
VKKTIALIIKLTVTVALLYFAVGSANLSLVADRLQRLNIGWFSAAILLLGLQAVLSALRWQRILGRCGADISTQQAVRFTFVASFFNQVLPSTVGGDAARIWFVAQDGAGWSKAVYSVGVDRIIGVLVLAMIVVISIPASFALIPDHLARAGLLTVGLSGVAIPGAFIALGCRQWQALHHFAMLRHLNAAANHAYDIFTSARVATWIVGLSVVIHGLTIAAAWLVAKSVAVPFDLPHAILLIPPVLLIAALPISIAGWGVRESAMVMAFAYSGLQQADGLLVSALLGFALFVIGIIGGLVWVIGLPGLRLLKPAVTPPRPL